MRDCFSLTVAGADSASLAGFERFVFEFLSYGGRLREFFAAVDEAQGCALLNAHAAALHLAFEGAAGWLQAAPYLERMRLAVGGVSERERLFCTAVERWAAFDFVGAMAALDELTVRWPADLAALKWAQYHAFNLGDQAALLRFAERARIVHAGGRYVHGMIAFALEQNHRLREAEEEGMRAVEVAIDDAWAHHAVAHVLLTEGRCREGVRWLDHCAHTWAGKGVFIREHNWWHAAIFRLKLGDAGGALAIYDERLQGEWPEFPQEIIGASSMLWRLELEGVNVGERWLPLAREAAAHAGDHIGPFHDLHYVMALARGGAADAASGLIGSMARFGDASVGPARSTWLDVAAPAARGLLAFAQERYAEAADNLGRAAPALGTVGGSHAQRALFDETLHAARVRAAAPGVTSRLKGQAV